MRFKTSSVELYSPEDKARMAQGLKPLVGAPRTADESRLTEHTVETSESTS